MQYYKIREKEIDDKFDFLFFKCFLKTDNDIRFFKNFNKYQLESNQIDLIQPESNQIESNQIESNQTNLYRNINNIDIKYNNNINNSNDNGVLYKNISNDLINKQTHLLKMIMKQLIKKFIALIILMK